MRWTTSGVGLVSLLALTQCSSSGGDGSSGSGGFAGMGATGGAGGTAGGASGAGGSTATGGTGAAQATGGTGAAQATGGTGGTTATGGAGGTSTGGAGGSGGGTALSHDEVNSLVDAYKAAHPGNGGKDWDINAKTPAEIANDPDAQTLLDLCGSDQRPIIPELAWEYGGGDHRWINPATSPLVICVYTPVAMSTEHWSYDAAADNVTADVYVLYPDDNPCKDEVGAAQVEACIGDLTNFEILVDTASYNDGLDVGYNLSNASTDLMLLMPDRSRVFLHRNL